jgi:hypothetical protein
MICDEYDDSYQTPSEIFTEIQILRKDRPDNRSFVIVEGKYDSRLFSKFFDNKHYPFPACGKDEVIKVFSYLTESETGCIGIVDADCDLICGQKYPFDNLFLTDSHDIETMMLTSNALESVLSEYADRKLLSDFEKKIGLPIKNILLKNAEYLGYLRYHSYRHRKNWRFKELPFSQFISADTLDLDKFQLHEELKDLNNLKSINDALLLRLSAIIDRKIPDPEYILNNPNYDPWHLCQGHDLTSILIVGLRNIFGTEEKRRLMQYNSDLESALRLAYNEYLFVKTHLFKQILDWERKNPPYLVIKRELIE